MTTSRSDESANGRSVRDGGQTRRSPAGHVLVFLRVAAFWTAVFAPFAVGAVLLTGLESPAEWRLFVVLVATSVASLYVGHPYGDG